MPLRFRKVLLAPGETKRVQFSLAAAELAYYDEPGAAWVVEPINYVACVGPSSRETDLLRAPFRIGA